MWIFTEYELLINLDKFISIKIDTTSEEGPYPIQGMLDDRSIIYFNIVSTKEEALDCLEKIKKQIQKG